MLTTPFSKSAKNVSISVSANHFLTLTLPGQSLPCHCAAWIHLMHQEELCCSLLICKNSCKKTLWQQELFSSACRRHIKRGKIPKQCRTEGWELASPPLAGEQPKRWAEELFLLSILSLPWPREPLDLSAELDVWDRTESLCCSPPLVETDNCVYQKPVFECPQAEERCESRLWFVIPVCRRL